MSILFGDIRQVGMVVHSIDDAIRRWAALGVGPFFQFAIDVDDFVYRGVPNNIGPKLSIACGHSGSLQIELIQQHNDIPSGYTEFLNSGREGTQHISSWFANRDDYESKRQDLINCNFTLVHEGAVSAVDARFAYFEASLPGGLLVEISEGLNPACSRALRIMESAAANWDGLDPVRSFE